MLLWQNVTTAHERAQYPPRRLVRLSAGPFPRSAMVTRPVSNLVDLFPIPPEEAEANSSTRARVIARAVADYVDFLQELRPDTVRRLDDLAAPEFYFGDPFHSLHGTEPVKAFYRQMFDTVERPRFDVKSYAINERLAFLRWEFTCRPKPGMKVMRRKVEPKPVTIPGVAELRFDEAGRITHHIDYWDAGQQIYERLPRIGGTILKLRQRFSKSAIPVK